MPQEVPEPRLGDNLVGREDAHTINLGNGFMLRGQVAADDLVFVERHLESGKASRVSASPSSGGQASHPALNPASVAEFWHGGVADESQGVRGRDRYSL